MLKIDPVKFISLLATFSCVAMLCFYAVQARAQSAGGEKLKPPIAKIVPKDVSVHGDKRIDNYFWLRSRGNPEVIAYLKAENAYTKAVMQHTQKLQEALFHEMRSRIKETDLSVPVKIENYYYYSRTEEGKQYSIHCRKKGSLKAEEEIILDINDLAEGHEYTSLGALKISPSQRFLAYSLDTDGSERFTVWVKDLETGKVLSDQVENASYGLEWADDKTLFYTVLDEARRSFQLYRHIVGTDAKKDVLIYTEKDDAYFLEISKSSSKKYLFMVLDSAVTTEVRYLKTDDPLGKFAIIQPRQQNMEYSVEHHGDRFVIVTNDNAVNFKLMEAPISTPAKENWREILPYRQEIKIDFIKAFRDHLVVFERENGLRQVLVMKTPATGELSGAACYKVEFPEAVYAVYRGDNPDFNTDKLRFVYTSLVTPRSIYDYDMNTRKRELKKQDEVLGGYEPTQYCSERVFATAPDGTEVPISLVYKKGLVKNGKNLCYLYGYGSYGYSIDPSFSSRRLSLLDRGFVYALGHIRGGGTMGRQWYEDGKYLKKKNTFTDFIACAKYLIDEKYTSPEHLAISGGSAGGMLIGAVSNMRPDLFAAAVADVPFVDVVNTMLDPTIPLTVTEYEEWGNPQDETYYRYMKSYSPYDNVKEQAYPNMLITAGLNDPRVQYWEPAKWTAKLRACKTGKSLLLLKTNMGSGHGGASGRYDYLREIAFEYAFIFKMLGVK